MAKKQHIAKPGNTGTSAQRARCGAIMIPGMKVSGGHCKRCENIDARDHRAWLGAHDAMWRSARGLSVSTGIPHCVIGQFDGTPLQIVPASFNCATDGPRAIAACAACYPLDPQTGQRVEACPFCGSKYPSAAHLASCDEICGGVTTADMTADRPICGFCKSPECDGWHFGRQVDNMRQTGEYQPSAAITAMIAYTKTQPGYTTEQRFAVFRGIVVAIRTERPDWTDVQARDWLRAQLDSLKVVETVWCEAHQVTGAHVERADCVHPHNTGRHEVVGKCAHCDAHATGTDPVGRPGCDRHAVSAEQAAKR